MENNKSFITIFVASNLAEAHLIRGVLEANEIEVRILDENTASLYPQVNVIGYRIQVLESEQERALKIIEESGNSL